MTMGLHDYMFRRFHKTSIKGNPSSVLKDMCSNKHSARPPTWLHNQSSMTIPHPVKRTVQKNKNETYYQISFEFSRKVGNDTRNILDHKLYQEIKKKMADLCPLPVLVDFNEIFMVDCKWHRKQQDPLTIAVTLVVKSGIRYLMTRSG